MIAAIIYEDNRTAIRTAKFYRKAKHLDITFRYIWKLTATKIVDLKYCYGKDMMADSLC